MLSFSLLGIPVRVDPWFWVTLALIGGALGANTSTALLLVVIFVAAGFISILVHEMGHALTIRRFGLPTEIRLIAFGGFASYPPGRLNRTQSFSVTAAGPGVQFALGVIALLALRTLPVPPESLLRVFLYYVAVVSVFWAVLNCLPIHPLDGGQMLAAVLGPSRRGLVYLTGAVCAVAIGLAGFLLLRSWLLPIFMALFAWKNWNDYRNQSGG